MEERFYHYFNDKRRAFTLAEVLITLGIIGVVAALTIPTLMQKNQDMAKATKLKKIYSTLSNAYGQAVAENGEPKSWGLTSAADYDAAISAKMMNMLIPYLNISQNCTGTTGCFPNAMVQYGRGTSWTNWSNFGAGTGAKVTLSDGTPLATASLEANINCNKNRGPTPALQSDCGDLWVDVNGDQGPSRLGIDIFGFYLTNYGIIPRGTPDETASSFSSQCIGVSSAQWGCTAWVIYNENLDYLKCSSLSWSGAKTCP